MIHRTEAGRELTQGDLQDKGATLPEQIARGVTAIHINVSRVVNFDSQALEGLTEFDALAKSRGLELVLVDPSEVLSLALSITSLDQRLTIERTDVPRPAPSGPEGA
ncbi:MAG TPA: STAS domain-containing protein [Planctomycetota bacterium]|nr:STAS domain-containing protein [Planctomycetota bacterium]